MIIASTLWRRLDPPGLDACRLKQLDAGWQLEGMAVYRHGDGAAQLNYQVTCDRHWRSHVGRVHGSLHQQPIDLRLLRTPSGEWTVNDKTVAGLSNCFDLDFNFTPATNLIAIRRLALAPGKSGDAPAARLDVNTGTLEPLAQRYERRTESEYWYESPTFQFTAMLQVAPTGFVTRFPGLWEVEP